MSPYLVLLFIFDFSLTRLAMIPYGLDSNVSRLLANLIPSHLYFIIFPIVMCHFVSIKLLLLQLLLQM